MNGTTVLSNMILVGLLLAVLLQGAGAGDSQPANSNLSANQSNSRDIIGASNMSQEHAAVIGLGSGNKTAGKILRAGFQKTKPINDLDRYGNRSVQVILPQVPAQWAFDISQRVGNTSKFEYANSYKPIISISPYSRTKAFYQSPSNLSSRSPYNISGYPRIKIGSIMP